MFEFIAGILIGACPFILSRLYRIPQNKAEAAVSLAISRNFIGHDYHLLNNVTIRNNESTTQIDHILISQYGIFIIETKGYKGWIYGNEKDKQWTQVLYRSKFRFGNPIKQNAGHLAVIRKLFKLDANIFHSIIVFCGRPVFKTQLPQNVIHYRDLVPYIKNFKQNVLTQNQLVYVVGRLETLRLSRGRETDEEHRNNVASSLKERVNNF